MSDWARLRSDVESELENIGRLLVTVGPIDEAVLEQDEPSFERMAALSAALHSFYTGAENALKRTLTAAGEPLPTGTSWHAELLKQCSASNERRPAIITPELHARLRRYLAFRHFFRSAYVFELEWPLMRDLVLQFGETVNSLGNELRAFLDEVAPTQ